MPLNKREENETQDLGGVLDSADDTKVQFGRFVSLANWVTGKLKSIRKKRGPTPFQGNSTPAFKFVDNFVRTDCVSTFGTSIVASCTISITNGVATVGNGCGFFVCPCSSANGQFVQATYKNNRVGTPVSGIFLAVDPASTRTNFTGYGLIYDQSQATHKLSLQKWVNASLATTGTELGFSNTTLNNNDVITLVIDKAGHLAAARMPSNPVLIQATDTSIPATNRCIALAGVGTGATSTQDWTAFSGGCDESWIGAAPDCFCEIQAYRLPTNGCMDYIEDCYDAFSYFPSVQLNGTRATGCVSGDQQRFLNTVNPDITVRSGDTKNVDGITPNPLAGFSIWFGTQIGSTNATATEFEGGIRFTSIVGKPIAGYAFLVTPGSTTCDFTGFAVLFNYHTNKIEVVQYADYNLHDGSVGTRTVLFSTALRALPFDLLVVGCPNCGVGTKFQVIDNTGIQVILVQDPTVGPLDPATARTFSGQGFIWEGNTLDYGIHSMRLQNSPFANFNWE